MIRLTDADADAARDLYNEIAGRADADIADWMACPTG